MRKKYKATDGFFFVKPSYRGTNKGLLIGIIIVSCFLFLMFLMIFTYHLTSEEAQMSSVLSPLVKYHVHFMIIISSFGIAVGASVFYLMSQKVESGNVTARKTAEVVLQFLSTEERYVVKQLIEEKGKTLQSKLSRESGMGKVKVYRILARLEQRGVLTIQNYGKTNLVILQQDLYQSLT